MKNTQLHPYPKTKLIALSLSLLAGLPLVNPSGIAQTPGPGGRERIGIYDSRSVAIAYAGSRFQQEKLRDLKTQLTKAKEASDARGVARLEREGKQWQATLHRQGFERAPVDDLLANIAEDFTVIQQTAGVSKIVSKWNQAELDRHPRADRIDVTTNLVEAFQPTAQQRQRAFEIQKRPPVKVQD